MERVQCKYNNDEFQILIIETDIRKWQNEIMMIDLEVIFYINQLEKVIKRQAETAKDCEKLLEGLSYARDFNETFRVMLINYELERSKMNECDDLQCDDYFITEHIKLKAGIEAHFEEYTSMKTFLYNYLKNPVNQ